MRYFSDCSIFVLCFNDGNWIDLGGTPLNIRRYYTAGNKSKATPLNYPYISSTKKVAKLLKNKKIKESVPFL